MGDLGVGLSADGDLFVGEADAMGQDDIRPKNAQLLVSEGNGPSGVAVLRQKDTKFVYQVAD